ncbi:restriction endonuclease subunit S [Aliivibrio sifiae]|uniref:restriction endonuclease subunit S n=1 Tax=Aliivibrio sifiae TaxID=566293 RepID=UPI003D10AE99
MSSLPKGWMVTPLDSIASWGSGGTPKRSESSYYGGDIPWVKTGDLGPKYLKEASEYITQLGLDKSSAKLFKKGSVAIAMYGATIGKTSILKFDTTTNQACAVGQPIDGATTTEFLYYFLNSEKQVFIKKGKGGAQPNISQQLIKAHEVRFPPLAEQKRIVEKLDEVLAQVDTIKARLDGIPSLIKRFRQSVLASAVSGKLTNGEATNYVTVGEVAKIIGGLTKNGKRSEIQTKLPYLRVANVYENELRLDDVSEIGVLDKELKRVLLETNDILVVEGNGSIDQIGRVAIWNGLISPCVHQNHLIKVRANEDVTTPKYLLYYLMSPQGKNEIVQRATSGAGLYTLSISKISSINVILHSIEEQKEIVRLVDQYLGFADIIEAQVKKAQARVNNLTQSILAKAFRGELVPQDPNDEPADKLLERIAQARIEAEALAKAAKKAETARKKAAKSA